MRRFVAFRPVCLAAALSLSAAGCATKPKFVPKPSAIFESFVAIKQPRADVPVGALWIDGYGPYGEPAAADNLETVRSLTGVAISRELQLSLAAGILSMLGIEPALQQQFEARLGEVSIVRVKDASKLAGPAGQPRIVEALKAGTITVTSASDIGLAGNRSDPSGRFVRVDSGRTGTFTIEGRDLFVAMRVARLVPIRSEPIILSLKPQADRWVGSKAGLHVQVSAKGCSTEQCAVVAWGLAPARGEAGSLAPGARSLPLPRADGRGGLFTSVEAQWIAPCKVLRVQYCGAAPRLALTFFGSREITGSKASARVW